MDEEMEELRKAAWLAQVEFDRKQEAKKRKEAQEQAKKRKHEAKVQKDLLEAAFDGEDEDIQKLIDEEKGAMPNIMETADAHGNTLISEGGARTTLSILLKFGGNPNSQGEFQRSPLWRASFLGKKECVEALLEAGADPRLGNETGELPVHVAASPYIKDLLSSWDLNKTDTLIAQWEAEQNEKRSKEAQQVAAALKGAEDLFETAKCEHEAASKALKNARQELEKRIQEHDTCVAEAKPDEITKITLQQIHAAEEILEKAKLRGRQAAEAMDSAKLNLREKMNQQDDCDGDLPGEVIALKDLDDVIFRDVGDKLLNDGRWPFIIDVSSQSSVFFRYTDTNYISALSPKDVSPEALRRSLLGAIRFGKPFVVEMMDVDLWDELPRFFDGVEQGLFDKLLDKSLLKDGAYESLIREGDGDMYHKNQFQEALMTRFKCVFLTSAKNPNEGALEKTYAFRIQVTQ
ncbi:hypothetical protein BSKO_08441 [Bryopsis sp. KO-2023]|nr:hypothetical protein BSKO_08441 [Bryopsis sp. KO-2023]